MMIAALLVIAGCSLWRSTAPQNKAGEDIQSFPAVLPEQTDIDARTKAAEEFRQRACRFLENRKPDDAINLLERAISLDPKEGRNYYHLSRAWMMKGNKAQAIEFNNLAGIYIDETNEWHQKVEDQKKSIENMR
jgi:tetratricopeptide (TPR) repeat protein